MARRESGLTTISSYVLKHCVWRSDCQREGILRTDTSFTLALASAYRWISLLSCEQRPKPLLISPFKSQPLILHHLRSMVRSLFAVVIAACSHSVYLMK